VQEGRPLVSPTLLEALRTTTSLHALTLWQPWASAVVLLGKDVENRGKPPPRALLGRPLAIHAGLAYDEAAAEDIRREFHLPVADRKQAPLGAVVGLAVLRGSVRNSASRWAVPGQEHWLVEQAVALPRPIPCKGAQGFWWVPPAVLQEVKAQLLGGEHPPRQQAPQALAPVHGALPIEVPAAHSRCPWCPFWWSGGETGQHATRLTVPMPRGWPECNHGLAFLEDCVGQPAPPGCCAQAYRACGGPFVAAAVVAGGAL
jgi:hypothetical protein